ncbi:MAG: hypothetical protein V4685_06965 [Bacteroidota bacterium]
MIKSYSIVLITVFLFSCNRTANVDPDNLKFDSIEYGAYRWRTNLNTLDWEFFLAYYIKIYKDGNYIGMNHHISNQPATYFKGQINKISYLHPLLDSLAVVKLDSFYISPELSTYNGNTFALDFSTSLKRYHVDFLQIDAPAFLQELSYALDNRILKSWQQISPFDLSVYEQSLKRKSLKLKGELPKLMPAPEFKSSDTKIFLPPTKKPRN